MDPLDDPYLRKLYYANELDRAVASARLYDKELTNAVFQTEEHMSEEKAQKVTVKLSDLQEGPNVRQSLTDIQKMRVEHVRKIIGQHYNLTDEGFLKDNNPDREIQIWEAIAGAYTDEMKVRTKLRKVSKGEQALLFQVLLLTSIHDCDPDSLLQVMPAAKSLGNFRGAVMRYMKHRIAQCGELPDDSIKIAAEPPPEAD